MQDKTAEPIWLSADDIGNINSEIVKLTGETFLVRSSDLLESAAARPQTLHYYDGIDDLFILATRLIEAVGKNHCFEQGNKRTAFYAGILFLEFNNIFIDVPDNANIAAMIEGVIIGSVGPDVLARALRESRFED